MLGKRQKKNRAPSRNFLRNWWDRIQINHTVRQSVEELITNSHLEQRFFIMCLLSGLMATVGILLNDVVTLIAAMVLAPFLNPLVALAAGIVLRHGKLILYSLKGFAGGLLSVIFVTAGFTKILTSFGHKVDLRPFTEKFSSEGSLFLLLVAAFLSGFAAVYAWVRSNNNANLVGVAIAVSLIPIISLLGMLIGLGDFTAFNYFSALFGIILLGIVLGSVIAFALIGFDHSRSKINHNISELEH